LTPAQRRQVCAAFVHRWTVENAQQTYAGRCPACEQSAPYPMTCGEALPDGPRTYTREEWHAYHAPLTTDAEWIAAHAFHFTRDGTRLMQNQRHAEPAYLAR
jgi:hypothetical protein